jgi:hypothetical protein
LTGFNVSEQSLKGNPVTHLLCTGSHKKRELTSSTFEVYFAGNDGLGILTSRSSHS